MSSGGTAQSEKIPLFDIILKVLSLISLAADVVFDVLVAYEHYRNGNNYWLGFTLAFILIPSLFIQICSYSFYKKRRMAPGSRIPNFIAIPLYFLQLGIFERFITDLCHAIKIKRQISPKSSDVLRYKEMSRDTAFIRLIESTMESGPQLILQLYILSTYGRTITFAQDYMVIMSSIIACCSIAFAMVSYSAETKRLEKVSNQSFCEIFFDTTYRLFIIVSRVVCLTLFATEFKLWVFLVVGLRWLGMIIFAYVTDKHKLTCGERIAWLFGCSLLSASSIFCYLNFIFESLSRTAFLYNTTLLIENGILFGIWYPNYSGESDLLRYGSICFIWAGFVLAIFFSCIFLILKRSNERSSYREDSGCNCFSPDVENDDIALF